MPDVIIDIICSLSEPGQKFICKIPNPGAKNSLLSRSLDKKRSLTALLGGGGG